MDAPSVPPTLPIPAQGGEGVHIHVFTPHNPTLPHRLTGRHGPWGKWRWRSETRTSSAPLFCG